jgi:hypothetical protein
MADGKRAPEEKSEPSRICIATDLEKKLNVRVGKVYLQLHVNLVLQYRV